MIKKKKLFIGFAVLLLAILIPFTVYNAFPSKTVHIRENSQSTSNATMAPATREKIVQSADAIIFGKVTDIRHGGKWGKDVCTFDVSEDLKNTLSGTVEVYTDPGTFAVDKSYLAFIQITDVTTMEHPYNFTILNFEWEVSGNSLDYVPAEFKEFSRFSDLKTHLKGLKQIRLHSNTPKVITKFKDEKDKEKNSSTIIEAKVIQVDNLGDVRTFVIDAPTKIHKNTGKAKDVQRTFIISSKYDVSVGDTVLIYTNGGSVLAAREGCLFIKGKDKSWEGQLSTLSNDLK